MSTPGATDQASVEQLLRLGDSALVHGQRLSEWCGHGPALEEDIALANIALDCVGEARLLLALAGARRTPRVEGARDRRADELRAYPACTGLLR